MKASHEGAARALGHKNQKSLRCYNEQEDESLYTHKANIAETAIDKRLPQGPNSYHKPTPQESTRLINLYIKNNPAKIQEKNPRSIDFFLGPRPEDAPDLTEWKTVRARVGRWVSKAHRGYWEERQKGTAEEAGTQTRKYQDWAPIKVERPAVNPPGVNLPGVNNEDFIELVDIPHDVAFPQTPTFGSDPTLLDVSALEWPNDPWIPRSSPWTMSRLL